MIANIAFFLLPNVSFENKKIVNCVDKMKICKTLAPSKLYWAKFHRNANDINVQCLLCKCANALQIWYWTRCKQKQAIFLSLSLDDSIKNNVHFAWYIENLSNQNEMSLFYHQIFWIFIFTHSRIHKQQTTTTFFYKIASKTTQPQCSSATEFINTPFRVRMVAFSIFLVHIIQSFAVTFILFLKIIERCAHTILTNSALVCTAFEWNFFSCFFFLFK